MAAPAPLPPRAPVGARLVAGVFGFVFAGIGLTVITSLWTERGFGEPPLAAKLIGSLIALAFIAIGSLFVGGAFGKGLPSVGTTTSGPASAEGAGYACPACGARLGADADVSPKGDVKCGYCRRWFNIHG